MQEKQTNRWQPVCLNVFPFQRIISVLEYRGWRARDKMLKIECGVGMERIANYSVYFSTRQLDETICICIQHIHNIDNRFTNHKVHFTVMNHCTITGSANKSIAEFYGKNFPSNCTILNSSIINTPFAISLSIILHNFFHRFWKPFNQSILKLSFSNLLFHFL